MKVYIWSAERAGDKIRALRAQKGKLLREVAEGTGISRQMVGYYENGEKMIPPTAMAALATYFQVSLEDLFFDLVNGADYDETNNEEDEDSIE